jgi:proteic killer suppression protein
MIQSFRHRGLERFFEESDTRRIPQQFEGRLRRILARLQSAEEIRDMDAPGLFLHPLHGALIGFWSVRVSGNWRVIFRFDEGNIFDVDLVDYH